MKTLHASGFVHDGRPSGVTVAVYDGEVADVANGVLDRAGHPAKVSTVRSLDGWLKEVHAFMDVNGTEMWHVFTTASEPWPMAPKIDASDPTP